MANEENKTPASAPKAWFGNKKKRRSFAPPKGSTPTFNKELPPSPPKEERPTPPADASAPKKEHPPRPYKNKGGRNGRKPHNNRPRNFRDKSLPASPPVANAAEEELSFGEAPAEEIFVAPLTEEGTEYTPVLPSEEPCCANCEDCGGCPSEPAEEELPKVTIVGVRFKEGGKIYYFAPGDMTPEKGDAVIVETSRGTECGTVAVPPRPVTEASLSSPLKPLVRFATEQDLRRVAQIRHMEAQAKEIWNARLPKHNLDMTLVDVEYTFDMQKLIFNFTAEGRVDFREFVKELATVFKTRIELRQIGVRDEAKQIGGLGVCGRPFCCKTFLEDFQQVSIKMAKEQNLSLNSVKISGTCGRLMCCLRYENETYELESKKTPRPDTIVMTPDGRGIVTENNVLKGTCKVRLDKKPDLAPTEYHRDDLKVMGRFNKQGKAPSAQENDAPTKKEEKND